MQERRIGNSSDTLINATGQKFKEGGGGGGGGGGVVETP